MTPPARRDGTPDKDQQPRKLRASEIPLSNARPARRQNVGTGLLSRLTAEARWQGYKSLRITTGAENHAMLPATAPPAKTSG